MGDVPLFSETEHILSNVAYHKQNRAIFNDVYLLVKDIKKAFVCVLLERWQSLLESAGLIGLCDFVERSKKSA